MDLFAAYALAVAFTRSNCFFFFQFKIKTIKKIPASKWVNPLQELYDLLHVQNIVLFT